MTTMTQTATLTATQTADSASSHSSSTPFSPRALGVSQRYKTLLRTLAAPSVPDATFHLTKPAPVHFTARDPDARVHLGAHQPEPHSERRRVILAAHPRSSSCTARSR